MKVSQPNRIKIQDVWSFDKILGSRSGQEVVSLYHFISFQYDLFEVNE